ncbi:MAG TPA: hypothetical protein VGB71_09335 [Flavisolibacter sp.]
MNRLKDNYCIGSDLPFRSGILGSSYRWQVDKGNGFVNLNNDDGYNGSQTQLLRLYNASGSIYGFRYRCLVLKDGSWLESIVHTVKFANRWTGANSEAWEDASNWSCGRVPDEYTDVSISTNALRYPKLQSSGVCRSLTLQTGAIVTVKSGYKLDIKAR